ncbi:MAG: 4-hydroxy-tetrahydrodipicolinate synthase [Cyanobacteria bacterium P01_A01_bin.45]
MVDFGKILTAMITPFKEDGKVNYDIAGKLALHLADNGTDTVVVCGTTGESPTLSWDEEYELFTTVKKAVGSKALVMAGCGSNCTQEAIAATQKAAKLGVDGVLQVVPYYNKPPQAGLYHHFEAIANSSGDLPILLYNVPGRTGQNLQPVTVSRLAKIENIIGVKEAGGSLDQVSEIRRLTPPEFQIYSGDDSLTLPFLAVGGKGVVSVASHLVGNQLQQMIENYESGRVKEAAQIHLRLFPLFKALFITANPIPVKKALQLQGWNVGSTRLPLWEIDSNLSELEVVLKELSLI